MITVYSTPTCVFCHAVKEYFESKGVKYTDKDLTKDHDAATWVMDNTGQLAVPVIDIDGTVIVGFDRHKIDDALKKS